MAATCKRLKLILVVVIAGCLVVVIAGCLPQNMPDPTVVRLADQIGDTEPAAMYDRGMFQGWNDEDGDCINTRHEVLLAEADGPVVYSGDGCRIEFGIWDDPYSGVVLHGSSRQLDVDHVVALVTAWDGGAWAWTPQRRAAFANDQTNLHAIEAGENRSKGGQTPATYTPTNADHFCVYALEWAATVIRWDLTVDAADHAEIAARC